MKAVLIIGSAPDAVRARKFNLEQFDAIVVLNNAWRIRDDWTHIVYPEDFAPDRRPLDVSGRHVVEYDQFVPANNAFGGIVYAGGTMAFTGGYWALHALRPDLLAFLGCDMVYDGDPKQSHFYGQGEPDPLRDDPTLQDLEAKSERLRWLGFANGCVCVNLTDKTKSRLTFDRLAADELGGSLPDLQKQEMNRLHSIADKAAAERALLAEKMANCFYESGDYWNCDPALDPAELAHIDALWRDVFTATPAG